MRLERLTQDELNVRQSGMRLIYLEAIKGMSLDELNQFDKWKPKSTKHYLKEEVKWLLHEKYIVGTRLHHNPTEEELVEDREQNHLAEKFRAYYCLRFPDRIERHHLAEPY